METAGEPLYLMEKLYVSREGLEKMQQELDECRRHTSTVAAAIKHARELGDLRENAEYHAAREEQAMLQARIRDIEDKLARAVVFDESEVDGSKAYLGATVKVLNKKIQKEIAFTLVSAVEADAGAGKISVRSPIGQALLGKAVGDTVVAQVPAGAIELEILDISRQA